MLAAGVALLVHEWIVEPAMELDDAAPLAIAAVLVYPIMSLGLLLLAGRLAFAPGGRSVAFSLLLAGAFALHIGDLVFALGQIGRLDPDNALLEVPYLMAPTFFSAAVLHPTARGITRAHVFSKNELGSRPSVRSHSGAGDAAAAAGRAGQGHRPTSSRW